MRKINLVCMAPVVLYISTVKVIFQFSGLNIYFKIIFCLVFHNLTGFKLDECNTFTNRDRVHSINNRICSKSIQCIEVLRKICRMDILVFISHISSNSSKSHYMAMADGNILHLLTIIPFSYEQMVIKSVIDVFIHLSAVKEKQ